jgi:hypothetical protein
MKARLGVTTCDVCQQPMTKDERVMIVVEGSITESGDILTFDGSCVHYACHFDCWDILEKNRNSERASLALPESKYANIPKENLIAYGIYSVTKNGEPCSFERLVRECFTRFPTAFAFSRYPFWPDSLKFDRQLRQLRQRGWLVGGSKTLFNLTKFGERVAEETEQILTSSGLPKRKSPKKKTSRGVDIAILNSLRQASAYRRFLTDREHFSITEMELRALLQCTLETPLRVVNQNLQYSKNLAAECGDTQLLAFLEVCEQHLRKGREKESGVWGR